MMNNPLMIADLEMNKELDRAAMRAVNGGGILGDLWTLGRRTARRVGGLVRRQTRRTTRFVYRSARDFINVLF